MKKGSLILADSHQNLLEGMKELLESLFETVVMVANKKSLFEASDKYTPDLAIVDLSLPVTNKINITRQYKSRYPELKLIVLSVHDEPAVVDEVMSAGAAGFVLKRCIATDLLSAVHEVLKGGTYLSPSLESKK